MITTTDDRCGLPSASSFERIVFCPGSFLAEALSGGDTEESEIGRRGVVIHEALETGNEAALLVSDKIVKDKIRAIEEEALTAWLEENGIPREKVTILREQRVWVRHRMTLAQIASARLDFAAVAEEHGKALIVDAKTGFLDTTPAEINWQLRVQTVGLWHEYNFKVTDIIAAIAAGRGRAKFDPVVYCVDSLLWAEQQIAFYAHNAADQFAPRVPGLWCRYCKARGQCREAATFAILPVALVKPAPAVKLDKKDIAARVDMLDHHSLARVHALSNVAGAIFDAVKDRLKGLVKDELAAVGLELVPNSPMRKVTNIQQAYNALAGRQLVTDDEFRGMCKIGIGEIEETLAPRVQAMLKEQGDAAASLEDAKNTLKKLLEKAIEYVPKSPSLKVLKPKK